MDSKYAPPSAGKQKYKTDAQLQLALQNTDSYHPVPVVRNPFGSGLLDTRIAAPASSDPSKSTSYPASLTSATSSSASEGASHTEQQAADVASTLIWRPPNLSKDRYASWDKTFQKDWNAAFQELLDHVPTSSSMMEGAGWIIKMEQLCMDFSSFANRIAETIIAELRVPDDKKSLKPIKAGGIAGGLKYAVGNCFFKILTEERNDLYGDITNAYKVMKLELFSLQEFSLKAIRACGIRPALTHIFEKLGYRVYCTCRLPVGHNTLVYGSEDGGKSFIRKDSKIAAEIIKLFTQLNLSCDTRTVDGTSLSLIGPFDMEIHRGTDGRLYVVDTARICPPVLPMEEMCRQKNADQDPGNTSLFELFRWEYFSSLAPVKLASDCLADGLSTPDSVANCSRATHDLLERVIPQATSELCKLTPATIPFMLCPKNFMHQRGINMRYLGLFLSYVPTDHCTYTMFATELLARTIGHMFRSEVRSLPDISAEPIRQLSIRFFNKVFDRTTEDARRTSLSFWKDKIIPCALTRFPSFGKLTLPSNLWEAGEIPRDLYSDAASQSGVYIVSGAPNAQPEGALIAEVFGPQCVPLNDKTSIDPLRMTFWMDRLKVGLTPESFDN